MSHMAMVSMRPASIELASLPTAFYSVNTGLVREIGATVSENDIFDQQPARQERHLGVNFDRIPGRKRVIVIGCVTFSTGISTLLAGVIIIAIPAITVDLQLQSNLVLWYVARSALLFTSQYYHLIEEDKEADKPCEYNLIERPVAVYSLACGCTLLLCGSIADVVGNRPTCLLGCLLQCIFALACGFSRTGSQMIAFHACSGIAASFTLPSSVSLMNEGFAAGRSRNVAFASMGGAQPLEFGIGLTLGGVFTGTIDWQWGFYIAAITNLIMLILAAWQLPKNEQHVSNMWQRLAFDIDWIGALIATVSLAMMSYVIAAVTGSPATIQSPSNISLLIIAFAFLLPSCFLLSFSGLAAKSDSVAQLSSQTPSFDAFEQYQNFVFQNVEKLSPLDTSLRFLPAPIPGALTNVVVAFVVHRIRGDWIVILTTLSTVITSLLMAIINPAWSCWVCAFIANFLNPIGADGFFTVSDLLITSMFPKRTQGIAGGVLNTISQTGKSVGLALTALIENSVAASSSNIGKESPEALMMGYCAAFWFCMSLAIASLCISVWVLRKVGKVGPKEE